MLRKQTPKTSMQLGQRLTFPLKNETLMKVGGLPKLSVLLDKTEDLENKSLPDEPPFSRFLEG